MPDKCVSCGAHAVIEDDVHDGGGQKICIECGTLATGPSNKSENICNVGMDMLDSFPSENDTRSQICESCGDELPFFPQTSIRMCQECLELDSFSSTQRDETCSSSSEIHIQNSTMNGSQNSLKACTSCGGTNLSNENLGSDERLVCCDCGTVAGTELLTNEEFNVTNRTFGNNILTLPAFARRQRKLRGLSAGHEKISYLCNVFSFPETVRSDAEEMFSKVFYKPNVLHMHVTTKTTLAAACVFIVCRIHDIPVCITHFSSYVDRIPIFIRGTKIILNCLSITLPHLSLSSHVGHFLFSHGFSGHVIAKVKDILFLCRRAWLTQGRSREGLIIIAAYYAYCSTNKGSAGDISMKKFRQMFGFPQKLSSTLQGEISNTFLKLAGCIPWLAKRCIKSSTLHWYIDDILKYQNSLFHLAFKPQESTAGQSTPSDAGGGLESTKGTMLNQRTTTKRDTEKDELLPPVMKRVRIETPKEIFQPISPHLDLDSPDLKASEFDDDEISSYIFTPEEEATVKLPKLKIVNR